MKARGFGIVALAVGLSAVWSPRATRGDCIPGVEPPVPDVQPTVAEQIFLDDFGQALRRFKGMSLEAFAAEFDPAREYLSAEEGTFLRGDATGDGSLDLSDPISTLIFLFASSQLEADPACQAAMDADDSGFLSITDPIFTLDYLFMGGRVPPLPFPEAGPDPTADSLSCEQGRTVLDYDPLGAQYLDVIRAALAAPPDGWSEEIISPLSESQESALRRNGFVISDATRFESFMRGFGWVMSKDLPVYISVDSILDTLHLSFDRILSTLEEEILYDELDAMLRKMEAGVEDLRKYAGGRDIEGELDDVAFWICTARSLLAGEAVPCRRSQEPAALRLLELVAAEDNVPVDIFGWTQCEDFSQFRPRGHYTGSETLEKYFRCMMWVQRIGMKFLQLRYQAAIAHLLTRCLYDTGASENWNRIDSVVEACVGESDSLNPRGMLQLLEETGAGSTSFFYDDENYQAFVRRALETGAGRQRINSQVLRSNPTYEDGFTPLPPAFHLMGQRFIVDSFIFTNVVFDRVDSFPPRYMPSPLDAWFVLGNRATLPLLRGELETYLYHPNLAALEWIVSRYDEEFWDGNLYNLWLSALRTLDADTTSEPYPTVMRTRDWELRMLHAQLASWAHLRHDTILYAKSSYDSYGCEYPEGWVDPYPEFFAKLARYAESASARFESLGLLETGVGQEADAYFQHLKSISETLGAMAQAQLEGKPHTEEQVEFTKQLMWYEWGIAMGWYPQLIFRYLSGRGWMSLPLEEEATVADVHTSVNTNEVLHVGVGASNLMVLTAKTACGVKAYAGPVLSYFEFKEGNLHRMTDEEWVGRLRAGEQPPRPEWTESFIK
jgi:hypothetical protein